MRPARMPLTPVAASRSAAAPAALPEPGQRASAGWEAGGLARSFDFFPKNVLQPPTPRQAAIRHTQATARTAWASLPVPISRTAYRDETVPLRAGFSEGTSLRKIGK